MWDRGRRCGTEGSRLQEGGAEEGGGWGSRWGAKGHGGTTLTTFCCSLLPASGSQHRNRKRAVPELLCTEHHPGHSPLSAWPSLGLRRGGPWFSSLDRQEHGSEGGGGWSLDFTQGGPPRAPRPRAAHGTCCLLVIQGHVSPLLPILSPGGGGGQSITPTNLFGICSRSHIDTWEGEL